MMEFQNPLISVCVITFRRPSELQRLLKSLAAQDISDEITFEIIIVDNDADGTAESVVRGFIEGYRDIPITYEIEDIQGIPQARNHSVALARGEYFAFIDDDEQADVGWLEALYECICDCGADAVFGPVEPILPSNCAGWLRKGRFFDRPHHEDGAIIAVGRTGNALVRGYWLEMDEEPFDSSLRFVGGSDSDFFVRVRKRGGKLCWSEKAIVYEFVGPERLNLRWICMRAFRGGQGYSEQHVKGLSFVEKALHFTYRSILVIFSIIMTVLLVPFGLSKSIWWLRKMFLNVGQISVLLPFRYEEYSRSNYR